MREVWIAFATGSDSYGRPYSSVVRGVVLDEQHMVVKRDSGYVGVVQPHGIEVAHDTEAAAWRYCADRLTAQAHAIEDEAARCMRRAGSLASAEVVDG